MVRVTSAQGATEGIDSSQSHYEIALMEHSPKAPRYCFDAASLLVVS